MTIFEEKPKVWVLEDTQEHQAILTDVLSSRFDLEFCEDLAGLTQMFKESDSGPSILLADLNVPDGTFLDFYTEHRNLVGETPVIVISTNSEQSALEQCFELGASDYLIKPFKFPELIAKIGRWQRECSSFGHVLKLGRAEVELTRKEKDLYDILTQNSHRPLGKQEILETIWKGTTVSDKALSFHLRGLRTKLNPLGIRIDYIQNQGYRLSRDVDSK